MPALLERVLGKMVNAQLVEERFNALKDMVQREYCNFFKEQPYQHAMYMSSQAPIPSSPPPLITLCATDPPTYDKAKCGTKSDTLPLPTEAPRHSPQTCPQPSP